MHDADERDDIGAFGQRVAQKVAAVNFRARQTACRLEPLARPLRHRGKIDQNKLQIWRARRRRREKGALAAADVHEALVLRHVV